MLCSFHKKTFLMIANADGFHQGTDLSPFKIANGTEIMVKRTAKASPTVLAY